MTQVSSQTDWLATCPKGLELLLAEELQAIGAEGIKETVAAVHFQGSMEVAYRACLWSRLANRILMPLHSFMLNEADDLYQECNDIPWEAHFSAAQSIAIDFIGTSRLIDNTMYGSQRVKDAIVDRIRRIEGERPNVDTKNPDIRIQVRQHKGRVTVSLDISGESLHRRGYRTGQGTAPIKENLAVALLLRANWPAMAAEGGALLDPMCGSGTLIIEGAMMAADIAPGMLREHYGFDQWIQHDAELWQRLIDEAHQRKATGLENLKLDIRGYDANPRVLEYTSQNIENVGLDEHIRLAHKPIDQFGKPTAERGLLLTNPPYGERLGEVDELIPLYQKLGTVLQKNFQGWRAAIFTGNVDLGRETDLSPTKQYSLFNGTIPCKLLVFEDMTSKSAQIAARLSKPAPAQQLTEGARMVLNRLKKNQRKLDGWRKKSGISCYRLYDADIPEYAVAVDIYDQSIYVQEYAPPSTISEKVARERFGEIKQAVKEFSANFRGKIHYKERRRQKGDSQYERLNSGPSDTIQVSEGNAQFEVNLSDYLDTGLFLDHRPVRALIGDMVKGKSFLNLFCYTAAASVQAAIAGASHSLSIDMSNTYLDWAQRNFDLNSLRSSKHQLLRADCLKWLEIEGEQYDVIFLDPPTFSNSKKMDSVLDIQRDHGDLIRASMAKLVPGGTLIFSNNFRKFKMDELTERQFDCQNITPQTLDLDFERNPRIHNVWKIKRRDTFG
ncbi:MAG: bifunctional 23S rRNA (guanine(2069)-N(7))-methyltransferase RlmK/23S rRNA (guanine(2445)-N(2))-methyltransferase RlmL [Porticoccaceae bacterium]|nr:bifunctional 23S rRNA (guanine(2069)-N(7))-methyltransferase RlmK/23S rRNA (guanine(2445)-N(2))-methyltransferase RlmL [Porticoccaceae bacterium]MBT4211267.1 bifunctional 23S rRNA (guanine(2069)-N(7))-methyltransferase RlmK/23S rRNA (guanine(2445)-N(2))-methyltransferase RlmL [Porticoccaceae bacterium]MBT7565479.1 bifunctional 23S rRNA (guanine(2069)-N(7))-methyltransferase RlmK/23S rRNA (guanine(2445)-N(2))-methyltransferase RlmL [Porticoccaceae bacterium]MBT7964191.1 bifunctional 23S rRNA (